jgi:putative DNA methylase
VANCAAVPELQEPVRDPARFPWHEVRQIQHYWLEVDAMTRPMGLRDEQPPGPVAGPRTMIPRDCKRLAEVDFPIAVVSKHAAREKSIRHGHLSTLHLWWARRPLASCRAMLLALLLPDPCDEHCPAEFKATARDILRATPGRIGNSDSELRKALLDFIGDFANWDHAANPTFLETGRGLVKAAHPDETPLVVASFSGSGRRPG